MTYMNLNLEALEKNRAEAYNKNKIFFYIAILAIMIAVVLFILTFTLASLGSDLFFSAIVVLVIGLIILGVGFSKIGNAKKKIKNELVLAWLNESCDEGKVEYLATGTLPELNEIIGIGFLKDPDNVIGADFFAGYYKSIRFSSSDVTLQELVETTDFNGKKSSKYETYYDGRMIVFNLEYLPQNMCFIEKRSNIRKIKGVERVQTEVSALNERYFIGVSNQEEVFKFLTPSVLKKFTDFEEAFKGIISYIFYNNKLYLFIENSKKTIDLNLRKSISEEEVKLALGGLEVPLQIIDGLKLTNDFFRSK